MTAVLLEMGALILCGLLWRAWRPGELDADTVRQVLGAVVYYLLLPALVLLVMWRATLGLDSLRISVAAASGVLGSLALAWGYYRLTAQPRAVAGAMLLAAGFPNATYLGLPVLESLYGEAGRGIAIQYDLFACTPLLLTVGILIAQRFGTRGEASGILVGLLRIPSLWAAVAAIALNLSGVPLGAWAADWLERLAAGVIPLMLFSLGLGLGAGGWRLERLASVLPVLLLQLALMPLGVWAVAAGIGLHGTTLQGVVLEAAMPSMVLGLVFCDRFGLDTGLYATAVTLTTALSLASLPLWFAWLA